MPRRIDFACNELRTLYEDMHLGTVTIAQRYGCSPTTIAKRLRECGARIRSSRFEPRVVSEAELRQLYLTERLPLRDIAHRLGVSISTVSNRRRMFGIPRRPRS